ncbi:hypothetical protein ACFRKD_26765 [Streptomyces niveus]|uniref:zinc finger domain-containing protein n=1 Tax=Streptomyces niveus TaxID=193462 RepID=UPI0036BB1975
MSWWKLNATNHGSNPMDIYTALRMTDDLSSRMLDALRFWADNNPQGSTARTNNGNGGGTHGALVRRGLVGPGADERGHVGYFLTPKAWAYLRHMNGTVRQADANRLDLDAALTEAYPAEQAAPETPRTPVATQAPAEDLTDTVTCPTCHVPTGARCITRAGKPAREPHGRRFEALEEAAGITQHRATRRREAQARGYTSNGLDHKAEEALLTAYAARIRALIVPDSREPIVARASFRRADLDRLTTEAAVERATYRAEMDERQAADHRAHGVPVPAAVQARIDIRAAEQLPARHVIGGVGVSHKGTVEGSTPADATHPNVLAARAALDGLAVATMTDHHDVTEPTGAERHVRGYLVDPREGARVAVYWLEGGRIARRGTPDGAALDGLAERLTRRGWAVEKMFRSSQCVFAHRPSTD